MNSFRFLNYHFDRKTLVTNFRYQGPTGIIFTETIEFAKTNTLESLSATDWELIDRALFLSFILIGTSYYKSAPTTKVELNRPIDQFQANFFSQVYQSGLSQFAFENQLKSSDLADFTATTNQSPNPLAYSGKGILSLQSGGKDSLLTATLLKSADHQFTTWYLSSSNSYPKVLDQIEAPLIVAKRSIDLANLQKAGGLNGHVPVTFIVQSLALVQALLNHQNIILTSIGQEGNEPHAFIDDLAVNHQWSKTWAAEQLFAEYLKRYLSPDLHLGSALRNLTELKIAELFYKLCWPTFGQYFSSCNQANYKQSQNNQTLSWCGQCAKCANSWLLFSPFLPHSQAKSLFSGKDLFLEPKLHPDFKGLLGLGFKPFECVGEIAELQYAYHHRLPGYANLPFKVPNSATFNPDRQAPVQPFIHTLNLL